MASHDSVDQTPVQHVGSLGDDQVSRSEMAKFKVKLTVYILFAFRCRREDVDAVESV